ncbi:MAG: alpha/beta fold hydrolase [Pseudomonadota bacterium]
MTRHSDAIASIAKDFAQKKQRLPWVGADLQTLRNTLLRPNVDLGPWPAKTITVGFGEGPDTTLCFVHEPSPAADATDETVALIHGLGGDASGTGIAYLTRAFLEAGYPVVRLNLRAAPMVYALSSGIAHAGKSEDLAAILSGLDAALGQRTWLPIGISLGGNLLARALGDGGLADISIKAAMTICAPLDMKAASDRILAPRNAVYARHLLRDLQNAVLKTGMDAHWKDQARQSRSVYDFDDRVTGPYHGFGDAERYYAFASAGPHLPSISIPTLVLHAADDPWIPCESYAPFRPKPGDKAQMLIVPRGGHVGFHFQGEPRPGYCSAALTWFGAA